MDDSFAINSKTSSNLVNDFTGNCHACRRKCRKSQVGVFRILIFGTHDFFVSRKKFVSFEGTKTLTCSDNTFTRHLEPNTNDWAKHIKNWIQQIDENTVGNLVDDLQPNFTDLSETDLVAGRVCWQIAVQIPNGFFF